MNFHLFEYKSEAAIKKMMEAEGWTVLAHGLPDLTCFKDGKVKFIEVKRMGAHLSKNQKRLIPMLLSHGIDIEVFKVEELPNGEARIAYRNCQTKPQRVQSGKGSP